MKSSFPLLRLKSSDTAVAIAPDRGAIVTSFRSGDRELLYFDAATFNDPAKNVRGGIPVLFPTPGKLTDDRWSYAGRDGELKQHGFARNLAWTVVAQTDDSATLALDSSATTRQSFPWDFEARLTYSVTQNTLRIEFNVTNASNTPMPFAFGLHPYFTVNDKASARIPTHATRAFDNVAKAVVDFSGFDLTQDEVDLHLIDHHSTRCELQLGDGAKIALDTSPEFTRWIVWTVAGKNYVCLEPWTAPGNALNTGEGLSVLAPKTSTSLWVEITARG